MREERKGRERGGEGKAKGEGKGREWAGGREASNEWGLFVHWGMRCFISRTDATGLG